MSIVYQTNETITMINQNVASEQQTGGQQENVQLEQAFKLFNQFSEKLTDSYTDLESQVTRLTLELAEARSERLKQRVEKEMLATRLEGLLDVLPAGIIVLDKADRITQVNPLAFSMLSDVENCLVGSSWKDIAQNALLNEGDELRLKDGRWINVSARPLRNESHPSDMGKLILISDVTENKKLQNKLNQQQRLSALGEMIAGLAHQIRTPLSSALLYITTLNHPLNDKSERIEFAEKAKQRLLHLERMVSEMLLFAKGDVVKSEYINTYEFMTQFKKSFELDDRVDSGSIKVSKNLKNVIIQANSDVLLSSIQNIIDNAIDACIEEDIDKSTSVKIDAFLNNKNQFELNVLDNGCGMSQQTIDKIFQPFFTTKSTGTGLGLAVANATVNRYGGVMLVHSEVAVGSRFTITFPRSEISGLLPSHIISNKQNKNSINLLSTVKENDTREVVL